MPTVRMRTATSAVSLLLAGAALSGCSGAKGAPADQGGPGSGSGASTGSTSTLSSPQHSSSAPESAAAGIPDGTWAREITTAEITRRGLTLAPEEMTSNYLDDGSVQLVLKTQGKRWTILVQDDAGEFEVGDLGSTSYDGQGRWVQSSDSTGSALLLVWEVDGNALTTSGLTLPDGQPIDEDGTHLFTEGTWQRTG